LGIVINFAVFSQNLNGGSLLLAALAINLFVMSLLCFWSGAYINRLKHGGLMVFGHAILFLSAGTGFFGLGYHSIMSKSCIFLVNDTASRSIISRAADWAIVNDYCPWLGIGLILFGIFMAWPSLKLLFSFMRLKGTLQSAHFVRWDRLKSSL
jgi:hypothetical protein